MFERLRQSNILMYELRDMLFKKVDIERMENYEAIMMSLTKIKKDLVMRTMPLFPFKMVMVGVVFQLRGNLMYVVSMHKEGDRPDQ
jgi:hypothetical protein